MPKILVVQITIWKWNEIHLESECGPKYISVYHNGDNWIQNLNFTQLNAEPENIILKEL